MLKSGLESRKFHDALAHLVVRDRDLRRLHHPLDHRARLDGEQLVVERDSGGLRRARGPRIAVRRRHERGKVVDAEMKRDVAQRGDFVLLGDRAHQRDVVVGQVGQRMGEIRLLKLRRRKLVGKRGASLDPIALSGGERTLDHIQLVFGQHGT